MLSRATLSDLLVYKESPDLNQSYLSKVVMRGKSMNFDGDAQLLGDLVDMHLTVPDLISEIYTVFTGVAPSDQVIDLLTGCMEFLLQRRKLTDDMKNHKVAILKQAQLENFDQKKKEETLWNSLLTKGEDWWRFSVQSIGKTVVLDKDRSFAYEIAEAAKRHPEIAPYFTEFSVPGREIHYQYPIYFPIDTEYGEVNCKALLDEVIVSHTKKKIYIIEIKTIYDAVIALIMEQIKKHDYVDQMSFYREAIRFQFQDLLDEGYEIDCHFLFIPKNLNNFNPVLIPCTESMLDWSRDGGFVKSPTYTTASGEEIETVRDKRGWLHYVGVYKRAMSTPTKNSFAFTEGIRVSPIEVEAAFFS